MTNGGSQGQTEFFKDLPMDNPDALKKKRRVNCLQDMLLEQMDKKKITLSSIQRATGIAWGTLQGWHDGDVGCQLADENLLKLAQYLKVSLEYLVYGLGEDTPMFEEFEENKND